MRLGLRPHLAVGKLAVVLVPSNILVLLRDHDRGLIRIACDLPEGVTQPNQLKLECVQPALRRSSSVFSVFDFVNVELRFSSLPPAVRDEFHGCMFSSCLCAAFNRWRKPLVYSSSGWWCCSCVSSNARKTSTRCFLSITRSACSNSRTPVRYRAVFIGLQVFIFVCG